MIAAVNVSFKSKSYADLACSVDIHTPLSILNVQIIRETLERYDP